MATVGEADIKIGAATNEARREFLSFKAWAETVSTATGYRAGKGFSDWFNRTSRVSTDRSDNVLDRFVAKAMPKGMTAGELFSRGFTLTSGHGLTASTVKLSKLMGGPLVAAFRVATPGGRGLGSAFNGAAREADNLTDSLSPMTAKITEGWNEMAAMALKTPGIMAALTPFISAGTGVLGLAGSFVTLAGDASLAFGALLPMPAVMAALGAAGFVVVNAFKGIADYLPDVVDAYTELNSQISATYWEAAKEAFSDLAFAILPTVTDGMLGLSQALGETTAYLANALNSASTFAQVKVFFDNATAAAGVLKYGLVDLTQGFITLISATSIYLPQIAGGFNKIAAAFNQWVQASVSSGELFTWVDQGVAALKAMGTILVSTVSIFYSLYEAISKAGGPTLQGLADGFVKVDAALKTEEWRSGITLFFKSVFEDTAVVVQAMGRLAEGFYALGPVLDVMSANGAAAFKLMMDGIASAMENPTVQANLTAFFENMLLSVESTATAIEPLFQMLSTGLRLIGEVAAAVSPGVAMFFTTMGNSFNEAAKAAVPAIEVLGTQFTRAMEALTPLMATMVQDIFPLVIDKFGMLATLIGPLAELAAGVLGPALNIASTGMGALNEIMSVLVPIAQELIAWVTPLASSFMDKLAPAITDLISRALPIFINTLKTLGEIFLGLLPQIQPILVFLGDTFVNAIKVLTPVITFLMTLIQGHLVGAFRGLVTMIGSAAQMIVAIVNGDFAGAFEHLKTLFMGAVEFVWNIVQLIFIGKVLAGVRLVVTGFIKGFMQLPTIISTAWSQVTTTFATWFPSLTAVGAKVWAWLLDLGMKFGTGLLKVTDNIALFFRNLSTHVTTGVAGVLRFLVAIPQRIAQGLIVALGFLKNLMVTGLTAMWQSVVNVAGRIATGFTSIWPQIQAGVAAGFAAVKQVFSTFFTLVVLQVRGFATSIGQGFAAMMTGLRTAVSSGMTAIRSGFTTAWNAIRSAVSAVWTGLLSVIRSGITNARSFVTSGLNAIRSVFTSVWNALRSLVSSVMGAIQTTISSRIAGARSAATNGVNAIRSAVTTAFNAVRSIVSSVMTAILSFITSKFASARNAVSSAVSTIKEKITSGFTTAMNKAREAVTSGISKITGFFREVPGKIRSALGNAASILTDAGRKIIDGFLSGLKSSWGGVKDFVGGIADWIRQNKGPLPYDARLLIPAGMAIMGGLVKGLANGMTPLERQVKAVTESVVKGIEGADTPFMEIGSKIVAPELDKTFRKVMQDQGVLVNPTTAQRMAVTGPVQPPTQAPTASSGNAATTSQEFIFHEGAFQMDVKDLEQIKDIENFANMIRVNMRKKGVTLHGTV